MCGIVGYIGKKQAKEIIVSGLKKLEYRGYDSFGIVTIDGGKLELVKHKGRIGRSAELINLKKLNGTVGLGHTRWATHGKPSRINAHPHVNSDKTIAIVHNGIIENFSEIKNALKKEGFVFKSDTDSEVIVCLISKFYRHCLKAAVKAAVKKIKGSYALGVVSIKNPQEMIAVRRDSSLAVGLGDGENFITSDVSAILSYTKRIVYLEDNQIAVISKDNVDLFGANGAKINKKVQIVNDNRQSAQKEGFDHFMLKEIYDQPKVISRLLSCYLGSSGKVKFVKLGLSDSFLKRVKNILILACGTAYHAGLIGKYAIESFTKIPVSVDLGSEFRYRNPVVQDDTLVIAISQSGETADTLAAVREAKKNKVKILAICNVLNSALTREADAVLYTDAGYEISVASTKAYTAQLTVIYLFGIYLAGFKKTLNTKELTKIAMSFQSVPRIQKKILENLKTVRGIVKKHLHFGAFLYLGRNINYPTALEGALKLKEISYIPAEGYAAGEMKHGPIALIDEYRAVVCIANNSCVLNKIASNIQEVLARNGKVIAIATIGNKWMREYVKEVFFIPEIAEVLSPLVTIIPLQLLAYYMAVLKGYDVDKPRNLAKSVTVE